MERRLVVPPRMARIRRLREGRHRHLVAVACPCQAVQAAHRCLCQSPHLPDRGALKALRRTPLRRAGRQFCSIRPPT